MSKIDLNQNTSSVHKEIKKLVHQCLPDESIDIIAVALLRPEVMPKSVFLALQEIGEWQDMDIAMGHDCAPGFQDRQKEVSRLMDNSPWTLNMDHGCVRKDWNEPPDQGGSSPSSSD